MATIRKNNGQTGAELEGPYRTDDGNTSPNQPSIVGPRQRLIRWLIHEMLSAARSRSWWSAIGIAVGALLLLWATAGCQNEFRIRVEKLDTPGHIAASTSDPDATRMLATLHEVLVGLDGVCIECRRTAGDETVSTTLEPLSRAQQAARALLPALEALIARQARGETSGPGLSAEIDLLRRRAAAQIPDLSAVAWDELIEAQPSTEKQMQLAAAVEQWRTRLAKYAADLAMASTGQAGFGGFRQAGVYRINPGDAAYDAVLKARPIGNPLTMVSVRATGDSGFMIVQESPGQMRLYELTNDPVALTRNVSFIIDKVLQAAVKFSSPVGS